MKLEANTAALPRAASPKVHTIDGKPERMAWVVLFGAFVACIALTILIPVFGFQFLRFSTLPQIGTIQAAPLRPNQVAPVRVLPPNVSLPIAVINTTGIVENSRVETDTTDNSRAFLTFFDNSTATIYKDSQITLSEMRQPRFGTSEQPNTINIEQPRGVVRYGIAPPLPLPGNPTARPTQFLVRTPQFDVWLYPGSYAVEVNDNVSQVSVRDGSAALRSRDGTREVLVGPGQRLLVDKRKTAEEAVRQWVPIPAAQDLIFGGEFSQPIDCSPNANSAWKCYSDQGGDGGAINGSAGVVTKDNRAAVQIKRVGSERNSSITGIRQIIDRDVSDYRFLSLTADVRVDSHDLSGGGYLSSEYPLIIRIKYRDVNGDEAEYVRGFYAQNDTGNPTANGELLPLGTWLPFDSSNLLASLAIKPFRILSIEIYASGWDYESYISNVRLKAE